MVSAARRAREKANLRRAILDAARELFVTEDYKAISMRRIADKIEYSPTTIYLYFKDKEEILTALCAEGFELLSAQFERLNSIADPVERLRQSAYVYLEFARNQAHYFKIMFQMETEAFDDSRHEFGRHAFGYICNSVAEAQAQGKFIASVDQAIVAHTIWAHIHGAAALMLAQRLEMLPEEAHPAFYDLVIETALRGLLTYPAEPGER